MKIKGLTISNVNPADKEKIDTSKDLLKIYKKDENHKEGTFNKLRGVAIKFVEQPVDSPDAIEKVEEAKRMETEYFADCVTEDKIEPEIPDEKGFRPELSESINISTHQQDNMAPIKEAKVETEDGRKSNRGDLRVPDHLKKPRKVYVPTGNPRGRRPGQKNKKKNSNNDSKAENKHEEDDGFVSIKSTSGKTMRVKKKDLQFIMSSQPKKLTVNPTDVYDCLQCTEKLSKNYHGLITHFVPIKL